MQPTMNSRFAVTNVIAHHITSIPTAAWGLKVSRRICVQDLQQIKDVLLEGGVNPIIPRIVQELASSAE
eukprot:2646385-Prorocentrum_lima.AAC.1